MTKYLISFPATAMEFPIEELQTASDASHAVVQEAKDAGVWVFGGGLDEAVAPVRVAGDGSVTEDTYEESKNLTGGFAVLAVPTREEALAWAAKLAAACRCRQEVRQFAYDPES